jgi:hypothetical protein
VSLVSKLTMAIFGFAALEFLAGFFQSSIGAPETPSAAQNPRIDWAIDRFAHPDTGLDAKAIGFDVDGASVLDENPLHLTSRDFIDRIIAQRQIIGDPKSTPAPPRVATKGIPSKLVKPPSTQPVP